MVSLFLASLNLMSWLIFQMEISDMQLEQCVYKLGDYSQEKEFGAMSKMWKLKPW